ncbi:MAG: polar amino acid transport system permease protein [Gaiellales bacterium]|jgi:polar amino acid transport system permease protein|nr:polar amino acid transport system permease protein [Gaiellales bacterium]
MAEDDKGAGRGSLILGGAARNVTVAMASTIVVFTTITLVVVNSPGWEKVKTTFFDPQQFRRYSWPIGHAFVLNIKIAVVAEVLILILALALAVMRSLPGPVFFPIRAMAIVYTDLFRGVPTILLVYLFGFGVPALALSNVPNSPTYLATAALVMVYTAYVSEVYRSGIESVHPSQDAAARSLGLSRWQAMKAVILPQAVRRVIPPLLNDFIGLQKDTALISVLGVVEVLQRANLASEAEFNYTPYVIAGLFFVAITIPQARLTDWLINRDRRRQMAGGRM